MKWLRRAILVLAALYAGVVAGMYLAQDRLMFAPDHAIVHPHDVGLAGVEEVKIATTDGETLAGWYTPAAAGRPTILFLHGKGGNIGHRPNRYRSYAAKGFGVLFLEWRGFGASTGMPSEAGLVTDATAAYDWLLSRGLGPDQIAVVGESLGTGIAAILATRRPVKVLALEAAYSSMADIAAYRYWWLPARLLIKNPIDAGAALAKVHLPLLMQHGTADATVPFEIGHRLFDLANQPKQFVVLPGEGHAIFTEAVFAREAAFILKSLGTKTVSQ